MIVQSIKQPRIDHKTVGPTYPLTDGSVMQRVIQHSIDVMKSHLSNLQQNYGTKLQSQSQCFRQSGWPEIPV